ncbi:MAG TPA: ribosomal protein S18-alanine N-acetyltransferase [Pyrinomonadaceae bacterium]|jgi:ribosomal-protein-alanine N-acetyltransferase
MSRTETSILIETEEFCISSMSEHDLLEVVEIEEASGLSRWGWEAYHAELSEGRGALMLVARGGSLRVDATGTEMIVVGFIAARLVGDAIHINNVAVREVYRRRGIGGALLSAILREGARRGARMALLEVRATNLPAQALYARHGFRAAGRRRNYYTDPTEDALVMSAALLETGLI